MKNFRLVTPFLRRHWWMIAIGLSALMLVDLAQLFIPRLIKRAVDQLTLDRATLMSLLGQAGVIFLLGGVMALLRVVWRRMVLGQARLVERDLRGRVFDHLSRLSVGFFKQTPHGDLMARMTNDLDAVRMAVGIGMVAFVDGIFLGLAAIGFMLWIHPGLTLIAVLPMPLLVVVTRRLSRLTHRRFTDVQAAFSGLTEMVRQDYSGVHLIQAYQAQGVLTGRLDLAGRDFITKNIKLIWASGLFFPVMLFFTNLSAAAVLLFGGRLTINQAITTGDFVAFGAYLALLSWPMMALGWVISLVQRGSASLARLGEVLAAEPEVRDAEGARPALPGPGGIEIRDLRFTYPGQTRPILQGVDLKIPAGRITGLTGPTGSGKSTLLSLIGRLYETPADSVFLDGTDIRDIQLASLRSRLAFVPQESFLFSDTIRYNIAFGRPEAPSEEIAAAAEASGLAHDLASFPAGLDTLVGERGLTLSGGQRQRVALARAWLTSAPILLADDALSHVDAATERLILEGLLGQHRTVVLVTHRPTVLARCDHVAVLDRGRIIDQGPPAELMAAGGAYAALINRLRLLEEMGGLDNHER
jgi:ATP-binding cassette subfamily B multidrug efflux pump